MLKQLRLGIETESVKSGSSKSACGKSAGKSTVVAVGPKKDKPKEMTVVKKKGGTSTSKKSAKLKKVVDPDPDVFHKPGKSSKK